jgi:FkbM family methyltransferase
VRPGALVFDVGAFTGELTEAFLDLDARVVAVEPQAAWAERIRQRYRSSSLSVENVALGAEAGYGELHVGTYGGHSTLSSEWVELARRTSHLGDRWSGTIEVRVETLDALVERYGLPEFLKIDVEGHEDDVLRGLSHSIPALSFEFLGDHANGAARCMDHLASLGSYEYNAVVSEGTEFVGDEWQNAVSIRETVRELSHGGGIYGNIYARERRADPALASDLATETGAMPRTPTLGSSIEPISVKPSSSNQPVTSASVWRES